LLLAERGLIGDSRVVLRSAVEGVIALHAVANDPEFVVDGLIAAHHFNQRKLARLVLNNPGYRETYSPEDIAMMEATVEQVDAMEVAQSKKLGEIRWADVAKKHCDDLYQLLYRLLSSDGTHTTLNAINRYVAHDAAMQITAVNIGPDTKDLVETLKTACLTFLWAADPFARVYDRSDTSARIMEQLQRFRELPQAEPSDVEIVSNFAPRPTAPPVPSHDP
jgi:hypothetical protein